MILEGIRVLEISNLLAGPYWAMILGERVGEHTVEILTEEGFSPAEIENLKRERIV
jgi:crotonobetainyl-CoA:carnitine CoA-transferase CaiB-like acyl-CoA transferase